MPFRDRTEAGRALAAELADYAGRRPLVLALPRGGVPVAAEVAAALGGDLDLLLVRKIGVPMQPELAMGAVVDGSDPITVRNEDIIRITGVTEAEFAAVRDAELAEIERRRARYLGSRVPADPSGRIVIIVDDGIATGATVRTALRALRARGPKEVVVAVPVAPKSTIEELESEADKIICVEAHFDFGAIGFFYDDFQQITDQEVIETLARFAPASPERRPA
jgi:putative phosphoribosyl transferase